MILMDPRKRKLADRSQTEMAFLAGALYDAEKFFGKDGFSEFVYDEELDVFRFAEDGRFAFCDEFADWKLLEERAYLDF